jgi:hypothetical protein
VLERDSGLLPVEISLASLPRHVVIVGELPRIHESLPILGPPSGPLVLGGTCGSEESSIGAHGARQDDLCRKVLGDGGATVGDVTGKVDPAVSPGAEDVHQLASEAGLLLMRILGRLTIFDGTVQPEKNRQGPGARGKRQLDEDSQNDPAVTKGEDFASLGRAHGVEVAGDPEDVGALLRGEGVVDDRRKSRPNRDEPLDEGEEQAAHFIGIPSAPGEEAMKGLVMMDG